VLDVVSHIYIYNGLVVIYLLCIALVLLVVHCLYKVTMLLCGMLLSVNQRMTCDVRTIEINVQTIADTINVNSVWCTTYMHERSDYCLCVEVS
jgi:hypothetical protein